MYDWLSIIKIHKNVRCPFPVLCFVMYIIFRPEIHLTSMCAHRLYILFIVYDELEEKKSLLHYCRTQSATTCFCHRFDEFMWLHVHIHAVRLKHNKNIHRASGVFTSVSSKGNFCPVLQKDRFKILLCIGQFTRCNIHLLCYYYKDF